MKYTVTLLVENEDHIDECVSREEVARIIIDHLNNDNIVPTRIGGTSVTAIECKLVER